MPHENGAFFYGQNMLQRKQHIYTLLMEVRDYHAALKELGILYAHHSKDEFYWVNSIVALQKLGEHERGFILACEGLRSYPASEPLNINAAHAYLSFHKDKSNIEAVVEYLKNVHLQSEYDYILARFYYFNGDHRNSCTLLEGIDTPSARYSNLHGENLVELTKNIEAISKFEEAITLDKNHIAANWNLSLAKVRVDDVYGWKNYHYGFDMPANGRGKYVFSRKKRIQEQKDLEDTVTFWGEQGIGDCVVYAHLLPQAAIRHNIAVTKKLVKPFQKYLTLNYDVIDISTVVNLNIPNIPLGDLPDFSLTNVGVIQPRPVFKKYVPSSNAKKRIGICWRGGINTKAQLKRSVPLGIFKRVSEFMQEYEVVPLQYNPVAEELDYLKRHFIGLKGLAYDPVEDLDRWIDDIFTLDALVSVDNSAVHFAGAFGIPTLMLTNELADFRWGLTDKNQWYPSVQRDISSIDDLDNRAQRIKDFLARALNI